LKCGILYPHVGPQHAHGHHTRTGQYSSSRGEHRGPSCHLHGHHPHHPRLRAQPCCLGSVLLEAQLQLLLQQLLLLLLRELLGLLLLLLFQLRK